MEHTPRTILFVDDEKSILSALRRLFIDEEVRVLTAEHAMEAIEMLRAGERPAVIISDQRMPQMSGSLFLAEAKKIAPDTIRMILSGHADIHAAIDAVNVGEVSRYIMKPWDDDELKQVVHEAIERYELVMQNQRLSAQLAEKNRDLAELNRLLEHRIEERTRELSLLIRELQGRDRIQQLLMRIHPLDELLAAMLTIIGESAELAAAYYPLDDEGQAAATPDAITGFHDTFSPPEIAPLGKTITEVLESKTPARLSRDALSSLALFPVAFRDTMYGVLLLGKEGGSFSDKELRSLNSFAEQMSIGIHDCRFEEHAEEIGTTLDDFLATL